MSRHGSAGRRSAVLIRGGYSTWIAFCEVAFMRTSTCRLGLRVQQFYGSSDARGGMQMEKRGERACGDTEKYPRCRLVLQRALTHNLQNLSGAAQLCQAWGLLEVGFVVHRCPSPVPGRLPEGLGQTCCVHRTSFLCKPPARRTEVHCPPAVPLLAKVAVCSSPYDSSKCRTILPGRHGRADLLISSFMPAVATGQHLGSGVAAGEGFELRPPLCARPAVAVCAAGASGRCEAAAAKNRPEPVRLIEMSDPLRQNLVTAWRYATLCVCLM